MLLKEDVYVVSEPKYLGKFPLRQDILIEVKSITPQGWFFGDYTKDGSLQAWRMDRMTELPESDPIKIAFTKYEKEQIEKTGRKDWWNCEKLK